MGITVSGLTTFPIDTWIEQLVSIKQAELTTVQNEKTFVTNSNSALSTVQTSFSSLRSALEKLTDAKFGTASDLFASNKVTSSNTGAVSATVTSYAARQNIALEVSQLATHTKVESSSASPAGAYMDRDTKFSALSNGSGSAGNMSVFVDNQKYSIAVEADDTVGAVLDKITSATGLWAEVKDGKISIAEAAPLEGQTPSSTKNIVIGSTSDTTNFSTVTGLVKNEDGAYQSSKPVYKVNTKVALTSADAGFSETIKEGSFKIGDATFTIEADTTLTGLISQINSSTEAGVNAYWDSAAGKIVLTAEKEGAYNLNIENISGNFTDVLGLTVSEYDENGDVISSKLADGTQTLGKNALLKINGTDVVSPSNTITSDISGITGLTFNLISETEEGKPVNLKVEQDTSSVNSAISTFVSSFNTIMTQVNEATGSDGYLYGENTLNMLKNNLRQTATARIDGQDKYDSLALIGITTGAIGSDINADTSQLQIDSTKLAAALAEDPEAVKKLLLGDGTNKGVLEKLETQVESALDTEKGYFAARQTSFKDELETLTDTIDKKTEGLNAYRESLKTKFSLMEQAVTALQNQYSKFLSS